MRDPMVSFLLIGAAIFAIDFVLRRQAETAAEREIVVTQALVTRHTEAWIAQAGHPPSDVELGALIEAHIREEILVREARARGLDDHDAVIRRRLAQKLSFLLEDDAGTLEPSAADLRAYFDAHSERYAAPATVSLSHVYFGLGRGATAANEAAQRVLDELSAAPGADELAARAGDPFPLPRNLSAQTQADLEAQFGREFAAAVWELPDRGWHGPLRSPFGAHLVRLSGRSPAVAPAFAGVQDRLAEDLRQARREAANAKAYAELRTRYHIRHEAGLEAMVPRAAGGSTR